MGFILFQNKFFQSPTIKFLGNEGVSKQNSHYIYNVVLTQLSGYCYSYVEKLELRQPV